MILSSKNTTAHMGKQTATKYVTGQNELGAQMVCKQQATNGQKERVSFLVTGHSRSVTFPVPTCGGDVGVQPLCSASTSPPPSRQNSYSKPGAVEACVQPHNSSSVCLPPLRPPTSTQDWLTRAPATGVPRIPNSAA